MDDGPRDEGSSSLEQPPTPDEIERALAVFRDSTHIYHETVAANEHDALAECRRPIGLARGRRRL